MSTTSKSKPPVKAQSRPDLTERIREQRAAALIRAFELATELAADLEVSGRPEAKGWAKRAQQLCDELQYVGQSIDREEIARQGGR